MSNLGNSVLTKSINKFGKVPFAYLMFVKGPKPMPVPDVVPTAGVFAVAQIVD
jgi:hypothetical protein